MRMFNVGDVAMLCGLQLETHKNGMECEIIEPLRLRKMKRSDGSRFVAEAYKVREQDGTQACVTPDHLKPLPHPNTPSAWFECIWRPPVLTAWGSCIWKPAALKEAK